MKFVSILEIKTEKKVQMFSAILLKTTIFINFLFFLPGCSKPIPDSQFDSVAWKADPFSCKNQRKMLLPELDRIRGELAGVSDAAIQKYLGKPEATTLTDKSEHIYMYYIEPGSQCQDKTRLSGANKLLVTVNGLSLVTEVRFDGPINQ